MRFKGHTEDHHGDRCKQGAGVATDFRLQEK